jgi:pilus assembly protein CpaB
VEVAVAGAGSIAPALHPGSRVDVLITTNGGSGGLSRTYLALQAAELVDFRSSDGGEGKASATLRVTLRQAVLLTAAQNFARELRLVPRPGGDTARLGPTAVSAGRLGL